MKRITWISIILFALLWFFFAKFWLKSPNDEFKFVDRDRFMVFPTPKINTVDLMATPSPKISTSSGYPTIEYISSSDSSVIKF